MDASRRRLLILALPVLGLIALPAWFVSGLRVTGDYRNTLPGADNAGPPLAALVHGQFAHLAAVQTVMGLTSLIWRAPFVAPAILSGAGTRVVYAVGALACMVPLIGLVIWMTTRARHPREVGAAMLAGLLLLLGPATTQALTFGHPEEMLTVALATCAVLAAQADHRTLAAILMGLAIGSKEWAAFALPALFFALPGGRWRAMLTAVIVGAVLTAPLPLLDPSAFHRADLSVGAGGGIGLSLWWPLRFVATSLPFGLDRGEAASGGLIVTLALAGAVGRGSRARRTHRAGPHAVDPLALLALVGLLRCICDPGCLVYYLVDAIIPLAIWEVVTRRRLPVLATIACGALSLCFTGTEPIGANAAPLPNTAAIVLYLCFAVVLAAYLTRQSFMPTARVAVGGAPATPSSEPMIQVRPPARPGAPLAGTP